jgi:hypothetical protein
MLIAEIYMRPTGTPKHGRCSRQIDLKDVQDPVLFINSGII